MTECWCKESLISVPRLDTGRIDDRIPVARQIGVVKADAGIICVASHQGQVEIEREVEDLRGWIAFGNVGGHMLVVGALREPAPSPTPDETNSNCGEYSLVEAGQDCGTVTAEFEITLADFLFLNPQVWEDCTNLWVDYYYCVRPVGYINTYPGYGGNPTTDSFEQTPSTPLPENPLANYSSSEPVFPIANGTRRDCYEYIVFDNVTEIEAPDCWTLAVIVGEIILWNPSLGENTTSGGTPSTIGTNGQTLTVTATDYGYPCTLGEGTSYCVAVASPTSTPDAYAVSIPVPRAAGEIENCTEWFHISDEIYTCSTILLTYQLAIEEFYAMNPSVKEDYSGLVLGTHYCVSTYLDGVPAGQPGWTGPTFTWTGTISPTSTTSTSTTTSGVSTPSPVQTGIIETCDEFYRVSTGDTCYDIIQEHDVALSDFYVWNPAVKTDCTGLQADVYPDHHHHYHKKHEHDNNGNLYTYTDADGNGWQLW
ncbi:hypothetical protein BDV12DRAFT_190368 [Aspergillus spectabilis]